MKIFGEVGGKKKRRGGEGIGNRLTNEIKRGAGCRWLPGSPACATPQT